MNGIIVVNKEKNMTSRDVINKLNKIFNTKKIGHTGTLDPIASGVLVTCIGSCTKLVDILTSLEKEYIAEFDFGYETDTLDNTGDIINKNNNQISYDELQKALKSFIKEYDQEVPKYSAVKINGKKLYEYAREGISIKLPSRKVSIYDIELLDYHDNHVTIKTEVSKGTYIRSLIRDIAYYLNTYATMTKLERTKQGIFDIKESYTLEQIANNNYKLLSADEVLNYKTVDLTDEMYFKIKNGQKIRLEYDDQYLKMKYQDKLIAIYKRENDIYRMSVYLEK